MIWRTPELDAEIAANIARREAADAWARANPWEFCLCHSYHGHAVRLPNWSILLLRDIGIEASRSLTRAQQDPNASRAERRERQRLVETLRHVRYVLAEMLRPQ
jgi:hypothetical protein